MQQLKVQMISARIMVYNSSEHWSMESMVYLNRDRLLVKLNGYWIWYRIEQRWCNSRLNIQFCMY